VSLEKRLEVLMALNDDNSKYWRWVSAVKEEAFDELNEWEQKFISDIYRRMDGNKHYFLTPNQASTLERIYAQYTK
jgi:hypothetical protein